MENIEKFHKIHYYSDKKELTDAEAYKLGLCVDPVNGDYESLEERAYQAAYDISNDWAKELPEWKDVQEGYMKGVEEGIEYAKEEQNKKIKEVVDEIYDWIKHYAWIFDDGKVNYATFIHDFFKDFRKYM